MVGDFHRKGASPENKVLLWTGRQTDVRNTSVDETSSVLEVSAKRK
jgi:hypothetical protein